MSSPAGSSASARATPWLGAVLVVGLAAALLLPGLGRIDLWAPDEPRYAQVAEELRQLSNGPADLIVLRLNGEVYTQKPPLYFWLAALVGLPNGRVDEAAARLPAALAGILVVALTWHLGRSMLGTGSLGALSAAVLLTLPRFAHQARRAQLDVLLTLFELIAIVAYVRLDSPRSDPQAPPARWLAILHGAVALAVLTKGPVGALPWLVIVVHRASLRQLGSLRALFPAWGILLGVGPALVWLAAVIGLSPAGYFDDAIVDNLLGRFFSGTDHVRPFYYFGARLPLDLLPWTPIVIMGAVLAWRQRNDETESGRSARLLLLWAVVFVLFFSISTGKRGVYMLPLLPGLSILAAMALAPFLDAERLPRRIAFSGIALLGSVAGAGVYWARGMPGLRFAELLAPIPISFSWSVAAISGAGAGAMIVSSIRNRGGKPVVVVFLLTLLALETTAFQILYPALDPEKSPRPLAESVSELTTPQDRVGLFRNGAFAGGLAFYSGRKVVVLESAGDVRDFESAGDRFVVVRTRDRAALSALSMNRVHSRARSGRRELMVVELARPRTTQQASPRGGG